MYTAAKAEIFLGDFKNVTCTTSQARFENYNTPPPLKLKGPIYVTHLDDRLDPLASIGRYGKILSRGGCNMHKIRRPTR